MGITKEGSLIPDHKRFKDPTIDYVIGCDIARKGRGDRFADYTVFAVYKKLSPGVFKVVEHGTIPEPPEGDRDKYFEAQIDLIASKYKDIIILKETK